MKKFQVLRKSKCTNTLRRITFTHHYIYVHNTLHNYTYNNSCMQNHYIKNPISYVTLSFNYKL